MGAVPDQRRDQVRPSSVTTMLGSSTAKPFPAVTMARLRPRTGPGPGWSGTGGAQSHGPAVPEAARAAGAVVPVVGGGVPAAADVLEVSSRTAQPGDGDA